MTLNLEASSILTHAFKIEDICILAAQVEPEVDGAIAYIEQYTCIDFINNTEAEFATLSASGQASIEDGGS